MLIDKYITLLINIIKYKNRGVCKLFLVGLTKQFKIIYKIKENKHPAETFDIFEENSRIPYLFI